MYRKNQKIFSDSKEKICVGKSSNESFKKQSQKRWTALVQKIGYKRAIAKNDKTTEHRNKKIELNDNKKSFLVRKIIFQLKKIIELAQKTKLTGISNEEDIFLERLNRTLEKQKEINYWNNDRNKEDDI